MAKLEPVSIAETRLSLRDAVHLLCGHDFNLLDGPEVQPFVLKRSREEVRPLWEQHREALTALCRRYKKGSHPFAFYCFDRGEESPFEVLRPHRWPDISIEDIEAWLKEQGDVK